MNFGIALPVTSRSFYEADEVMEKHIEKAKQTNGYVYFSTSNRIDSNKAREIGLVLFANKEFVYMGELVEYTGFVDKSYPNDRYIFQPTDFGKDIDLHWFKVTDIHEVEIDELNKFEMINKKAQLKYNGVGNYIKDTGRLQVFYFKDVK